MQVTSMYAAVAFVFFRASRWNESVMLRSVLIELYTYAAIG